MLLFVLQIHRNILSCQGHIRYADKSELFHNVRVEFFPSELQILVLKNDDIVKKVKINTPENFFIPSSLFSEKLSLEILDSTVKSRTILLPFGRTVSESPFRLQISGVDELGPLKFELKVDVKDYFRERFKNRANWNLFCAGCGVGLPLQPIFIESVREYSESELSEGWFCHGNIPQPALQPSSQILYLDDSSFYLYPRPDSDIYLKNTVVPDEKCCCQHDTDCRKSGNLNYTSVENNNDSDAQVLDSSSYLKQAKSSTKSDAQHTCSDSKHSVDDRYERTKESKALDLPVKCQSCGDVLTSEKSSGPFVRFYFDKLMFKNPSCNDDHLEYVKKITMLSFWTLVKRSQTSQLPTKLFLQNKVHGQEQCLLMWIPSTPVDQFLLRDSFENLPPEINLKTEPVYKVLYFLGTNDSNQVLTWRVDFNVDFYCVSDTMVKTLAKILNSSTDQLPKTFRKDKDGFACGFLSPP